MPRCVEALASTRTDTDKGAVDFHGQRGRGLLSVRPACPILAGPLPLNGVTDGYIRIPAGITGSNIAACDKGLRFLCCRMWHTVPLSPCDKSLRYLCLGTFVSTFVCPRHPRAPSCGIRTIYQSIPVTKKENRPGTILLRMALSAGVSASQYAAARGAGYFCFSRPYPPFARRYKIRKVSVSRSM